MIQCEHPWCPEDATLSASRVDAIRDHWYLCDEHRIPEPTIFEQTPLPPRDADVGDRRPPIWSLEVMLSYFPPKHRKVTRRQADAMIAKVVAS